MANSNKSQSSLKMPKPDQGVCKSKKNKPTKQTSEPLRLESL